MAPKDYDEHPGVAKVKDMWERGDFETIDRMVKFWEALEAFGRLGDLFRRFIIWCGVILGAYFVFTEWLVAYIKKAAGQ